MTPDASLVVRYQYDNHLGSASLELDESAEIISYEEYHPFGTTSYRSGRTETETSQKRYKYVGKERDEETGLYYYGARYYAAWICRFVSVDSLQFDYPYYTPYQYAGNKPISYIDLDGLEEVKFNNNEGYYYDKRTPDAVNCLVGGQKDYFGREKKLEQYDPNYKVPTEVKILGMATAALPALAMALPAMLGELSLITSTSWGSLSLVSSFVSGAASTTAISRGLAFGSDAGGQWLYQSSQNNWNLGVGFSKINWTSPTLDLINPSANILNGFLSSTFQYSIEGNWNLGTGNEIIAGTVSQFAFGNLTTPIKSSWINSISYEKELVNTFFEKGLFKAAQKQALTYGALRYGVGSGINFGMDATKVFIGEDVKNNLDRLMNNVNEIIENTDESK
ncbi:MAG: hypothetical protein GQ564_12950 [Bacteroidales bacterium]|nr:hypothetical protein [Bacteroidales bacterium]